MQQWSIWLAVLGSALWGAGYVLVKRSEGQRKLAQALFAVGCLAMLPVVGFGINAEIQKRTPQAVTAQQSQDAPKAKSLGFTVAEFKARFNAAAKRASTQQRVGDPVIAQSSEAGQVDTFRVLFGDNLAMIGSADKASHAVTDFLVLYVCEDRRRLNEELLKLVTLSGVLIEMCNPGVSGDQRVGVLRELGLFGGQTKAELRDFDKGKDYVKAAQIDQVRYSFRLSPDGRAYFTAQPL